MAILNYFRYWRLKFWATIFRFVSGRRHRGYLEPAPGTPVNRKFLAIPSRDQSRTIGAWLYYPPDCADQTLTGSSPVLINWHGSGFIVPSLGLDHKFCHDIARKNGILVLDVDYRKSPENPFPAALEDAQDVFSWVENNPQLFDLTRVAVSGFSAGGTLALVAASSLRSEHPKLDIKAVVVFYPCVDLTIDPQTKTVPNPIRPIRPWMQQVFWDAYAPDPQTREDPRISPSYAEPVLFPPNVTFITCSGDVLEPEGRALAKKLDDGTRKVNHVSLTNVSHGFDTWCNPETPEWEQKERGYQVASDDLKNALK
ncbi:hypothetical protein NM208_g1469 [Fusarium decemcellulare]|uniref:Uncharacterized protein n=1 Tax=Fusarium decemcellulare TaxID=57161 RepID=A0ACC1SVZ3_9HYPO|nr:hypothetical protein NM208_g1469 [Fusarium decemcellulare]